MLETSLDSEATNSSCSESNSTCSKERKHSPEPKSKLEVALEKRIPINKDSGKSQIGGVSGNGRRSSNNLKKKNQIF